jgi:type II secretory pathway pseudopilin PulG
MAEFITAVGILAVLTVFGIPYFTKISQRQALKSAARDIQLTLAAARMTAVKRNAPVSVVITSLTPPIQLQVVEPAPPAPTPTIPPKYVNLPANAVRFFQTPNTTGGTIAFGGDGRLTPMPGILTPAVVMIVEGPANGPVRNQIQIQTNRAGAVKVVTPVDWQ